MGNRGYTLGRKVSKQQLAFDYGTQAAIADTRTKLQTNFNHSKQTFAFNQATNRYDIIWRDACPWASTMNCVLQGISSSTKLFMSEPHFRIRYC
jgi:glutathionyl-hydroquinone reductase